MTTLVTVLTHPHCRPLKTYLQQLLDRAELAGDNTQWNKILAVYLPIYTGTFLGTKITREDLPQDIEGHTGKHLKWLLIDAYNRSQEFSDVQTDVRALYLEIAGIVVP